ncbi:MAG TPA: WecB/TagA/CpsF family glycosyltransferase [Candidatus Methylacidiphilales bacterium]|nr:WecB/TagA/CpsF family glycosyltransferase [Candidatus Methylacidiphilales bacterium]
MTERVNILGVGVDPLNLPGAVTAIGEAIRTHAKGYICVTGVHGVSEAQDDPVFRDILNRAFLNTPDGMPMVWMGWWQGRRGMGRVYGPDLMLEICRVSEQTHWRHFFYGGAPGVAEQLAASLQSRFPNLTVAGTYTPPFRPLNEEETEKLRVLIAKNKPDIIWVGLSTPKQEAFMAGILSCLDTTLMIGVGAAFDLLSGRVRQAPRWVQRSGFEWLYRLVQEPGRLWKRYLKNNPLFVWRAFLQLTGLRRYDLEAKQKT